MSLTIALNWWQLCLVIIAVVVFLLYLIDRNAQSGQWCPDIGAMILGIVVIVGGAALIIGIIAGKFIFGG